MLRAAVRSLVRRPSFTFAAAGTLALGIAAPTALFSTVNAALLKPLPYPRAQDIYTVRTYFPNGRFTIGLVASEELEALQHLSEGVAMTAATQRSDGTIATDAAARQVVAYGVSGGFFDLFALPMELGRGIAEPDQVRGAPLVIVLSHSLWTKAYGARPDIIGTTITYSDLPARIVGVARADFDIPAGADVWLNSYMPPAAIGHAYDGYVRLKPGVTVPSLQAPMTEAMAALGRKYPDQDKDRAFRLTPLLEATLGDLRPILLILFGATGLLLVLAAANVTNLMLAGSTGRAREMAVRAALGAGRRRIAAQLVAESLVLAVGGGVAGLAAAYAAVRLLVRFGGSHLPRLDAVAFDTTVVGFVAALIVAAGLIIGIVPALSMTTDDIASLMNEGGRTVRGSRQTRRLLGAFVVAEIAVAVALVAGASRLVESYQRLENVDLGFDPRGRLAIDVLLPRSYANQQRLQAWWQTVETRLREAGATRVAAASSLPLEHEWDSTTFVDILSQPGIPADKRPNARVRYMTPGLLSTMGIRLLHGRAFTDEDGPDSQAVAIVSEAFVRRFLHDADPLRERVSGFSFRMVNGRPVMQQIAIVGVAADVKYSAVTALPEPTVYVPLSQSVALPKAIVVTTADGHPERYSARFRAALGEVDRSMPVDFAMMSTLVAASLERPRLGMWLMSGFGVAALVLAMVGVFGVIAYVVAQRTGEMAIRQALGATRSQVFWIIVAEGGWMTMLGVAAGMLIAWWTGIAIHRYVYEASTDDPRALIGSAIIVALVAAFATLFPARRAATFEPARALREQ
ncbi:MAG TPA: ADOP family duplicated permease [Vicinamibacterales bacterium]